MPSKRNINFLIGAPLSGVRAELQFQVGKLARHSIEVGSDRQDVSGGQPGVSNNTGWRARCRFGPSSFFTAANVENPTQDSSKEAYQAERQYDRRRGGYSQ